MILDAVQAARVRAALDAGETRVCIVVEGDLVQITGAEQHECLTAIDQRHNCPQCHQGLPKFAWRPPAAWAALEREQREVGT